MSPTFPKGILPKQWPRTIAICQKVRDKIFMAIPTQDFELMKIVYPMGNMKRISTLELLKNISCCSPPKDQLVNMQLVNNLF